MTFVLVWIFFEVLWLCCVAQFLGDGTDFVEPGFLVVAVVVGFQVFLKDYCSVTCGLNF